MLGKKAITEFRNLYHSLYGVLLDPEVAEEFANNLIGFLWLFLSEDVNEE